MIQQIGVPLLAATLLLHAACFQPSSEALAEVLAPLVDDYGERLGLVVESIESGARFERHAQRLFPSASVYKLAVAHEVLRQVDLQELSPDDRLTIEAADALEAEPGDLAVGEVISVGRALEHMLGDSSNTAAYALMRMLGRPQLNAALADLGLPRTSVPVLASDAARPGPPPIDPQVAVTTPADMAHLLRLVATEQTLTPDSRAELHRLLALEEPGEPLGGVLPSGIEVWAKTGNLPGTTNMAGLIGTPGGAVIISVFTESVDPTEARATIAAIGRAVYHLYAP